MLSAAALALAKSCCALGWVDSCWSRSRDTRLAMRENVEVGAVGTGRDLATSEIDQDCYQGIDQGIENEALCVRGKG